MTERWKEWLEDKDGNFNQEELRWYADPVPVYYPDPSDPDQVEAARRFLLTWIHENPERFTIPGTEWGRSLIHWMHVVLSHLDTEETS